MGKIKVSIIVPIYNAEKFIQDTMSMLCHSTLKEIEILAVNDGSTDNSHIILKHCQNIDKRIKIIDKPNGGVSDARNCGLKHARGEYVCFCDQEDIVEPTMYEKMYQRANETNSDLIVCSTGRYTKGNKIPFWVVNDYFFEGKDVLYECFLPTIFNKSNLYHSRENINFSETIWKCMIARNLIEENRLVFRSYVSFEDDRLFILDVLARAQKVSLVSDVLYYWTINESSASHVPKYIKNFYHKDIKLENETIKIMEISGCEIQYIQLFKSFNGAYRYTRLVENEVVHSSIRVKLRINNIKEIYKERFFKENVRKGRFFPIDMLFRRIICCCLQIKMTRVAYYFCKCYKWIQKKLEGKLLWVNLQSHVKGKAF